MARITAEQAGQELEFLSGTFVVRDWFLYFGCSKWSSVGLAGFHFPMGSTVKLFPSDPSTTLSNLG